MNPLASIVVPTVDRAAELCATLTDLLAQTYAPLEIIVVDQSAQPAATVTACVAAAGGRIQHVPLATRGVTYARNAGLRAAAGEIVLFCDDDVRLGPEWAARHLANYAQAEIGAVNGQVLEPGQVPADAARVGEITACGRVIGNFHARQRRDIQHLMGCNFSVRRAAAQRAGGFDHRFGRPALFEEADFAFRLRGLGYRIVFDPAAGLQHLAAPRGGQRTRQLDAAEYYYHFIRLKTLFMLKNPAGWNWPCFALTCLARAAVTGLGEARSLRAFWRLAGQAPRAGWRAYRAPAAAPDQGD